MVDTIEYNFECIWNLFSADFFIYEKYFSTNLFSPSFGILVSLVDWEACFPQFRILNMRWTSSTCAWLYPFLEFEHFFFSVIPVHYMYDIHVWFLYLQFIFYICFEKRSKMWLIYERQDFWIFLKFCLELLYFFCKGQEIQSYLSIAIINCPTLYSRRFLRRFLFHCLMFLFWQHLHKKNETIIGNY